MAGEGASGILIKDMWEYYTAWHIVLQQLSENVNHWHSEIVLNVWVFHHTAHWKPIHENGSSIILFYTVWMGLSFLRKIKILKLLAVKVSSSSPSTVQPLFTQKSWTWRCPAIKDLSHFLMQTTSSSNSDCWEFELTKRTQNSQEWQDEVCIICIYDNSIFPPAWLDSGYSTWIPSYPLCKNHILPTTQWVQSYCPIKWRAYIQEIIK